MRRLIATLCLCLSVLPARAQTGFALIQVPHDGEPPIETAIWYPAEGTTPGPTRVGVFTRNLAPGATLRG